MPLHITPLVGKLSPNGDVEIPGVSDREKMNAQPMLRDLDPDVFVKIRDDLGDLARHMITRVRTVLEQLEADGRARMATSRRVVRQQGRRTRIETTAFEIGRDEIKRLSVRNAMLLLHPEKYGMFLEEVDPDEVEAPKKKAPVKRKPKPRRRKKAETEAVTDDQG